MRNGVYLLLGLLLVINRGNGVDDDNPYCRYDDETKLSAKCYHGADIEPFNPAHYVSMHNLSTGILNLTLQTRKSPKWKWHVKSLDYFKRFTSLVNLHIFGVMSFSSDLDANTLKGELFNIPTLQALFLYYNGFNSNDHLWTLPSKLKNLTVSGNDYTEFNINQKPPLEEISFFYTNLVSMPKLYDSSTLKTVIFRDNKLLEIRVEDIASYCHAETLILDAYSLQTLNTRCQCLKMKTWLKDVVNKSETEIFTKPLNCFNTTSQEDCQNNTLDTALNIRNQCLQPVPTIPPVVSATTTTSSGPVSNLLYYIGIAVFIITVVGLIAFIFARFFTSKSSPEPDSTPTATNEDKLDDDYGLEEEKSDDEKYDANEAEPEPHDDEESAKKYKNQGKYV